MHVCVRDRLGGRLGRVPLPKATQVSLSWILTLTLAGRAAKEQEGGTARNLELGEQTSPERKVPDRVTGKRREWPLFQSHTTQPLTSRVCSDPTPQRRQHNSSG